MNGKHCGCGGHCGPDGKTGEHNISNDTLQDSDDSKSKSVSIASRLDRLETEINLLLMLSTKQIRTSERPESAKPKDKPSNDVNHSKQPPFVGATGKHCGGTRAHIYTAGHVPNVGEALRFCDCQVVNKLSVEDAPILPSTFQSMKDQRKKEKLEHEEKKNKKLRKKKSVCRCKKKRSRSNVTKNTVSAQPAQQPPKPRSKSADPHRFINAKPLEVDEDYDYDNLSAPETADSKLTKMKILSRSCPTSAQNVRDLCHLVVDLNKNKNLAMNIGEQWKGQFFDMQQNCDALKGLQEQTNAQRKFLSICFQTEMEHRKMLEKFMNVPEKGSDQCKSGEDELSDVKESLALQRSRNEELLTVCDELRHELKLSEERLKGLQQSSQAGGRLDREMLEKFESNEEMIRSQASSKVEVFKKQIKDHLTEIEELRLTCAKNAEWACEESSHKSKLMQENKFLMQKISRYRENEQKQLDQVNILKRALWKVGKNEPKVKTLLQALHKNHSYDNPADFDATDATVGVHLTEFVATNGGTCGNPEEAKRLIHELNDVIKVQGSRIQELLDLTSSMAVNVEQGGDVDTPPSREKANELEMARKEVEEVKSRYVALATCVKELRNTMKQNKNKLLEESRSKASLQNDVIILSKQLEESKTNMAATTAKIEQLNKDICSKDHEISNLKSDLKLAKEEKEFVNKQIKDVVKQKDALKTINDRLRIDAIRQEAIINNLEKKFSLQQHEQVLQRLAVDNEKEQAFRAAQFATDKLMETMEDFRQQSKSQTKVRQVLTQLLHEKDEQLRCTLDKVSSMTLDPQIAFKTIKPTCQINMTAETHHNMSCDTAIDVHYACNDEMVVALQNSQIPAKRWIDLQSQFAEYLQNTQNDDDRDHNFDNDYIDSCTDEVSEYETPQLFTLHEEEEENCELNGFGIQNGGK